jgi:hypothetical protein
MSMARSADDLAQGVPGSILVAMLVGHADPCLLRRASAVGLIVVRVDAKERCLAVAVLQLVGVHIDHESNAKMAAPRLLIYCSAGLYCHHRDNRRRRAAESAGAPGARELDRPAAAMRNEPSGSPRGP